TTWSRPRGGGRMLLTGEPSLRQVKQQHFGRNGSLHGDVFLVGDGNAIASRESVAEDVHAAPKHLQPRRPSTFELVRHRLSGQQRGQIQASVLMNGQGAIGPSGRGDQRKPARLLLTRGKFLVPRLQTLALGQQPDLVEMDLLLVRRVELAVEYA